MSKRLAGTIQTSRGHHIICGETLIMNMPYKGNPDFSTKKAVLL